MLRIGLTIHTRAPLGRNTLNYRDAIESLERECAGTGKARRQSEQVSTIAGALAALSQRGPLKFQNTWKNDRLKRLVPSAADIH